MSRAPKSIILVGELLLPPEKSTDPNNAHTMLTCTREMKQCAPVRASEMFANFEIPPLLLGAIAREIPMSHPKIRFTFPCNREMKQCTPARASKRSEFRNTEAIAPEIPIHKTTSHPKIRFTLVPQERRRCSAGIPPLLACGQRLQTT